MRVYELMNVLGKMDAGAVVDFVLTDKPAEILKGGEDAGDGEITLTFRAADADEGCAIDTLERSGE